MKKHLLKKLEEKKLKQRELEIDMYHEIEIMFQRQKMKKADSGEEDGISDEDILRKLFGKKKYSRDEIKLIKKLRQKYQKENMGLVGKRNSSGEYIRYYPKNVEEQDVYTNHREKCIVGFTKGLVKNIKANSVRLGIDWEDKSLKSKEYIYSEVKKYIDTGNGNFLDSINFDSEEERKAEVSMSACYKIRGDNNGEEAKH
jgi:hypothetical protein